MSEENNQPEAELIKDESTRKLVITLTNEYIGDGIFCVEAAKTMREYADIIETGQFEEDGKEYRSAAGTKAVVEAYIEYDEKVVKLGP